jgi:hypothetical protein
MTLKVEPQYYDFHDSECIMQSFLMLSVRRLSAVKLSVIMLSVLMPIIFMLSVVVPLFSLHNQALYSCN